MAKGVKKVKWDGTGRVLNATKGSVPSELLVVPPSQTTWFLVDEWYSGTSEEEKKRDLKWAMQNQKGVIDFQRTVPSTAKYGFIIAKKDCGPYTWYIEASWSGNFDGKAGLRIRGESPARVVNSRWTRQEGKEDVRKTYQFSYGEVLWLRLFTEGLNGYTRVEVKVFRKLRGFLGLFPKDDEVTRRIYFCAVINGEINLRIPNTYSWGREMSDRSSLEEFYVRVVHPTTGEYIQDDNGDTAHARFLRIKKVEVSQVVELPQNRVPVTIYEPDRNAARFEPCKFEQIKVREGSNAPVTVFDNGAGARNPTQPQERITEAIFFEFNGTALSAESLRKLNNILQFILEHNGSSIQLDGFACVIGKQSNNKDLSEKRAETVKQFFIKGRVEEGRIRTSGKGEVNPTDDKMGRDNIKYRDELDYIANRRVDISFDYYGHNAETMVYEAILGSQPTNIVVEPVKFDTKPCFENQVHTPKLKVLNVNDNTEGNGTVSIAAVSQLASYNLFPIQYIWPTKRFNGTSIGSSGNDYLVHFHSCRYFSVRNNPPLKIRVYPDIKWELALEVIVNVSNYKATNMPSGHVFARHQEESRKAGYNRWRMNETGKVPISIGLGLSAEWDNGEETRSLSTEFENRIKPIARAIAGAVNILQNAINYAQSLAKKTAIPIGVNIRYPKFTVVANWCLERLQRVNQVSVIGEVGVGFKPLIGAEVIIDIIGAAIAALSYGTTGNPAAARIINNFRGTLDRLGASVVFTATFYGELEIMIDALRIDSINGIGVEGKTIIGGKMGVTIELSMSAEIGAVKGTKLKRLLEFKAAAIADAYFGGEFSIDSDHQGIFIEPELKFSGILLIVEITGEIGWWKTSFKIEEKALDEEILPLGKHYLI